ncbi:MAG: sulfate adenylyltransferase, partial [Solirubrobacterales bacterium]|nr:sulfate adenylyltransferase [Solirubrobacterales bacterium]
GSDLGEASAPTSVAIRLEDDLDISRGNILCSVARSASVTRGLSGDVCWMSEKPLVAKSRLLLKAHTNTVAVRAEELVNSLDVIAGDRTSAPSQLDLNSIGSVRFKLAEAIALDLFSVNRLTGAAILIDPSTNETVGSVLITETD